MEIAAAISFESPKVRTILIMRLFDVTNRPQSEPPSALPPGSRYQPMFHSVKMVRTSEATRPGSLIGTMCAERSAGMKDAPAFWATVSLCA